MTWPALIIAACLIPHAILIALNVGNGAGAWVVGWVLDRLPGEWGR